MMTAHTDHASSSDLPCLEYNPDTHVNLAVLMLGYHGEGSRAAAGCHLSAVSHRCSAVRGPYSPLPASPGSPGPTLSVPPPPL